MVREERGGMWVRGRERDMERKGEGERRERERMPEL